MAQAQSCSPNCERDGIVVGAMVVVTDTFSMEDTDTLRLRSTDVTFGGISSSCRNQELRSNFSMRVGRGGFSEVGSEFWRGISTL